MPAGKPSQMRQLLGVELARLRSLAGIGGREMADRLGISQPTLSRFERGVGLPKLAQVRKWLDLTAAPQEARERVLTLIEDAHQESLSWRQLFQDAPGHLQDRERERETAAARVRNFQPTVIPGLLQTAEYARLLIPLVDVTRAVEPAAALAARMDRQEILYDSARRFEFLIAEPVLRWSPGDPQVLAAQLDRLASLATLTTVRIGVVPQVAGVVMPWTNFVLYDEVADGDPFVAVELVHGQVRVSEPEDVALYRERWERMSEIADWR